MADTINKFKDLFCLEVEEQLSVLSKTLLDLEQAPGDGALYATLMRSAHTIKGGAATMGYVQMAKLAHTLEDLFHAGERKAVILDAKAISLSFEAIDKMTLALASIKLKNKELPVEVEIAALTYALKESTNNADIKDEKIVIPTPAKTITPHQYTFAAPTNIRVEVEQLDTLMGLFEEMLMLRLKLDTILEPAVEITKSISDPVLKQKIYFLNEFRALFGELARLLSETQEELLLIRLVPLEQIFSQFPRMIRDLSVREGKQVTFRIEGENVELDRTVLDGLGGALAHLLRNAVDHGIQKEGSILLRAERASERVYVIVEDNGGGVDYERVRQVAIERGVVEKEEGQKLRKVEIAELLFHPNMSTNEKVTDISGRGVGLSAVRAFVQDVGGRIELYSPTSDKGGTRFLIDLPVSLATVKVLIVRSSGFTFAIPFVGVIRTMRFAPERIYKSASQESIVEVGHAIPLLRLDILLGISFAGMFHKERQSDIECLGVLVSDEGEKVILMIDECVGEQELLVKSLPPVLRGIKGFSGSALLPDGRTILLLDTHGLLLQAFGDILENTVAQTSTTSTAS